MKRTAHLVSWLLVSVSVCSPARAELLSGVVLQENGDPAPGAKLTAAGVFRSPPLRLQTQADDQGAFQIDLPQLAGHARFALAVRWREQGADLIRARDKHGDLVMIAGQALPPVTIRLRAGGELKGRVLQLEDDRPIAGARLYLDTGEVLTTNDHGEFHINGLPLKDHSLIPVAPARVRQYVLFDTTLRPRAELELRLPRGAVIQGTISDENGQPIPGAFLRRASSGNSLTLNGWDERCNPDGSFEYGGLSTKRLFYSVEAVAAGYASQSLSSEVISPTQTIVQNKRLKRFPVVEKNAAAEPTKQKADAPSIRTVSGFVRDPKRRPLARASVRWRGFEQGHDVEPATTDESGRFVLNKIPAGAGSILIVTDHFAPHFIPLPTDDKPSKQPLEAVLSLGRSVRGVVRGTAGQPLAGVSIVPIVRCPEWRVRVSIWRRETMTNDRGEFKIDSLPAEKVFFDIQKDGYQERRQIALQLDGSVNKVQLATGAAIGGRVVDAEGRPVRNFNIRLMIPRVRQAAENVGGYYAGFDWYGVTFTRNDGVFTLSDIDDPKTWLRVIVRSPGVGRAIIDRVQAPALDQISPPGDLTITLEPFIPLSVRVLDAETKAPVADALVTLLEDEVNFARGFSWGYDDLWATRERTDATGVAVFSEPACEDGTLTVRAPGFGRRRIEWKNQAKEVTVSLNREARVEGEVRADNHLFTQGHLLFSAMAQDRYSIDLSDSNGQIEIDQLPAGEYQVTVSASGQALHSEQLRLQPGKTHRLAIEIKGPVPAGRGKRFK